MNLRVTLPPRSAAGSPVTPMLRTVLLCGPGSTRPRWCERLGDTRAAAARAAPRPADAATLLAFTSGRLIDKADGLLALFERPIQARGFRAALPARRCASSAPTEGTALSARVGIHVGDVMTWDNSRQDV